MEGCPIRPDLRGFVVPRGITVLAGGTADFDAATSENTTLVMKEFGEPFPHTDSNTLRRTAWSSTGRRSGDHLVGFGYTVST